MLSFGQFITELFDKKRDISYDGVVYTDPSKIMAIHNYSFSDHKGRKYRARIAHIRGDDQATVQFSDHNGDTDVTGKSGHGALHVFGAINQVLDYHTKHHLSKSENSYITKYSFDSEKEKTPGRWNRYQEGSRSKLYRKFTEKMGGESHVGSDTNPYTHHIVPVKRDN